MNEFSDGKNPRLVVRHGPNPDNVYILRRTLTVVGREPLNDVVVPDPEVSRRHARIFWEDGSFLIEDLNSTNGTFVNGRRLTSKTRLASGDIIDFGETIRVIYEHDIAPAAETESRSRKISVIEAESILETMAPFSGDRDTAKPRRPTERHKIAESDSEQDLIDTISDYQETVPMDDSDNGPRQLSSHWFLAFGLGFVVIIVISTIIFFLYLGGTAI